MPVILLLFIGVPIIEIVLFIEVGDWIGLWPTVATILITAFIGTALVRAQGLAVLAQARQDMDTGKPPVKAALTGVCLLVAGALLLTPGFLTDALGFMLLIPPVRMMLGALLVTRLVKSGSFQFHSAGFAGGAGGASAGPRGSAGPTGPAGPGPIIDGEFETVDDPTAGGNGAQPDRAPELASTPSSDRERQS